MPLFLLVGLFTGCNGADLPPLPTGALTLGASVALLIRRMLTDGTWPQKFAISDPYKSALAALLGAASAVLTAKATGTDWNTAFGAGMSGLIAVVQGLAEKGMPRSSESITKLAAVAVEREKKADSIKPPPPPPPPVAPSAA
jgi:hypothetical protein